MFKLRIFLSFNCQFSPLNFYREQRVTGCMVFILTGLSVKLAPVLKAICLYLQFLFKQSAGKVLSIISAIFYNIWRHNLLKLLNLAIFYYFLTTLSFSDAVVHFYVQVNILQYIPMPVLYGVLMYMGVNTLKGMQVQIYKSSKKEKFEMNFFSVC